MDMYRTIATGQPWRGEIRNRAKNGSYFWLDTTITATIDSNGHVTTLHLGVHRHHGSQESRRNVGAAA